MSIFSTLKDMNGLHVLLVAVVSSAAFQVYEAVHCAKGGGCVRITKADVREIVSELAVHAHCPSELQPLTAEGGKP